MVFSIELHCAPRLMRGRLESPMTAQFTAVNG